MREYNIAIEVGSSNTIIYKQGMGVVLKEPSILAVECYKGKEEVVAVGNKAKQMIGKTSKNIDIVSPICEGVIKNITCAKKMLEGFLEKIDDKKLFSRKYLVFCVPCGITKAEQEMYRNLGYMLNANSVELVPSVFFALTGMISENLTSPRLIVNMGGGITDIAVLAKNEIISGCTIAMGNNLIEERIANEILNKYNIEIAKNDAEEIKIEISTLLPNDIIEHEVVGVDTNTYETRMIRVHSQDFLDLFIEYYSVIVEGVKAIIKSCSIEVRDDLLRNGVYVCGGNASINGLERFLRGRLNLPIHISADPKLTTVNGILKLLNNPKLLNIIIKNVIY